MAAATRSSDPLSVDPQSSSTSAATSGDERLSTCHRASTSLTNQSARWKETKVRSQRSLASALAPQDVASELFPRAGSRNSTRSQLSQGANQNQPGLSRSSAPRTFS